MSDYIHKACNASAPFAFDYKIISAGKKVVAALVQAFETVRVAVIPVFVNRFAVFVENHYFARLFIAVKVFDVENVVYAVVVRRDYVVGNNNRTEIRKLVFLIRNRFGVFRGAAVF